MGRPKVYPRYEGKLLLAKLQLDSVEIPKGSSPKVIYKKLKGMIDHSPEFFQIRTKRKLTVFTTEEGWILCVEDERENVLVYTWLKKNATRLLDGMVHLITTEEKVETA